MADRKITDLTALAAGSQATGDLLTIVDVSEGAAADKNKKITVESLFKGIPSNVGIGTTSPGKTLSVKGSSYGQAEIVGPTGSELYFVSSEGGSSNGTISYTHGSNYMNFYTAGSERMRIDSAGNVGIGTTSAGAVVSGMPTLHLASATAGRSGAIRWKNTGETNKAAAYWFGTEFQIGTETSHPLKFTTADTERVRIDSSGRVGIGTTSPGEELVVRADAPSIQLESSNASGRNYGFQANNDGKFHAYDATAGANRITLDSSGNVGIGTTTIEANSNYNTLEIVGDTSSGGGVVRLKTGDRSTAKTMLFCDTGGFEARVETNHPIVFSTNNTEEMRLLSGGGLTFNGDTSQANALDDYEEGAHTIVTNTNLTPRSDYSAWKYTKIGNQVTISGLLYVSSVSGTNFVTVSLPFAAASSVTNGVNSYTGQPMHNGVDVGSVGLAWYIGAGSSNLVFYTLSDNASWGQLRNSSLTAADEIYCTVTYFTDA